MSEGLVKLPKDYIQRSLDSYATKLEESKAKLKSVEDELKNSFPESSHTGFG